MGGIELRNGTLVVEREPNQLDELAIRFAEILGQFDIKHVYIAGYVSTVSGVMSRMMSGPVDNGGRDTCFIQSG
jgi:hypothetical protein